MNTGHNPEKDRMPVERDSYWGGVGGMPGRMDPPAPNPLLPLLREARKAVKQASRVMHYETPPMDMLGPMQVVDTAFARLDAALAPGTEAPPEPAQGREEGQVAAQMADAFIDGGHWYVRQDHWHDAGEEALRAEALRRWPAAVEVERA